MPPLPKLVSYFHAFPPSHAPIIQNPRVSVSRECGKKSNIQNHLPPPPFPIIDIPPLEIETQTMKVEVEREQDGRWIAEVPVISGAMVYGATRDEAVSKVEALVLRILADRLEHGEPSPEVSEVFSLAT